jgi:hypothetical protein
VAVPANLSDPFADRRRFDPQGHECTCRLAYVCDCIPVEEDLFEDLSGLDTDYARQYYGQQLHPVTGDPEDDGLIRNVTLADTIVDEYNEHIAFNEHGVRNGQPRFRFKDEEIEEVYFLCAKKQRNHEIHPGRSMEIWGFRGGRVHDYRFDESGNLIDGFVIVGPYPETDINDRVYFGEKRYGPFGYGYEPGDGNNYTVPDPCPFTDLEVRTPGPELRFTYGRKTRIYVMNLMEDEIMERLTMHWHGFDLPHDQDGVPFSTQTPAKIGETWVYEYRIPNTGSRWVHQHYNTPTAVSNGMFMPVTVNYPDDVTTWQREYITHINDGGQRFTMNGNVYPGTLRRLSGWFRDVLPISRSWPAPDGSGDSIVEIDDQPRDELVYDHFHVPQRHTDPAAGAPIRPGTGFVDEHGVHVHRGHQILNRHTGVRVEIRGHRHFHVDAFATLNGFHYVTREGNSSVLLRIPRIGPTGAHGGQGGFIYVWRLHKSSREEPELQNNGCSGAYFKLNYGEEICQRWFNAAFTPHPLHIHLHQWYIFAIDGNLLDAPIVRNVYLISQAGTFDAKIYANNPNRYGNIMLHCHNHVHLVNNDQIYPGAQGYPGGMMTHMDYTGKIQGKHVVTNLFHHVHFHDIPPTCTARSDLVVARDILGLPYVNGSMFLRLTATAAFGRDDFKRRPLGSIVSTQWELLAAPSGAHPFIDRPELLSTRVFGLSEDGDYVFRFTATGAHVERMHEHDRVHCHRNVTVTVRGAGSPGSDPTPVDDSSDRSVKLRSKPINVRVVPGSSRGHVTLPLFRVAYKDRGAVVIEGAPVLPGNLFSAGDPGEPVDVNGHYWPVDVVGEFSDVYSNGRGVRIGRSVRHPQLDMYGNAVDVGLVPGAIMGNVTYALYRAVLDGPDSYDGCTTSSRRHVYFVLSEASDADFAALFGAQHAPLLAHVPAGVVDDNVTLLHDHVDADRLTGFVFNADPGVLPRFITLPGGELSSLPGVPNDKYSPVKRFTWRGRTVTVNAPMVWWGERDGQQLLVDRGGCDGRIRSAPPSDQQWRGFGPAGCRPEHRPQDRFGGGQVLNLDLERYTVQMKLHQAAVTSREQLPYFTVFDASDASLAAMLGVVHAQRTRLAGPSFDTRTEDGRVRRRISMAVGHMRTFANGIPAGRQQEGLCGFQRAVVTAVPGSTAYSPLWHLTAMLYNCGRLGTFPIDNIIGFDAPLFLDAANLARGAELNGPFATEDGQTPAGFNASQDPFDPFQMNGQIKKNACPGYVRAALGRNEVYADDVERLLRERKVFETDWPTGAELGGDWLTLVNAPMPVLVNLSRPVPSDLMVANGLPPGSWCIFRDGDQRMFFSSDYGVHSSSIPPRFGWWVSATGAGADSLQVYRTGDPAPRTVFVAVSETSDSELSTLLQSGHATRLGDAPDDACELSGTLGSSVVRGGAGEDGRTLEMTVFHLPGRVAGILSGGPVGNPRHSPLKRVQWRGRVVTLNMHMVKWGEGESERLVIDGGSCDVRVLSMPPSERWLGGGPVGCRPTEMPLDRYAGGQVLRIDEVQMQVTVKLHRGWHREALVMPYFTVWEASEAWAAGQTGGVHAPKLRALGRGGDVNAYPGGPIIRRRTVAVSTVRQFANGAGDADGGPMRFQAPVFPALGVEDGYTPMAHVAWLLFNCGVDSGGAAVVNMSVTVDGAFKADANIGVGARPVAGSGVFQFDPTRDPYDPYQMRHQMKGMECGAYVEAMLGRADGVALLGDIDRLKGASVLFETDSPVGAPLGGEALLVGNMPIALHVDMTALQAGSGGGTGGGGGGGGGGEEPVERIVRIIGSDDGVAWSVIVDGGAGRVVTPSLRESVADGTVGTVDVQTGDRIRVELATADSIHGVVFAVDSGSHSGDAEAEVREVLDVNGEASVGLGVDATSRFTDVFGTGMWGSAGIFTGPRTIFEAKVKEGQVGKSVFFSCFVHGPFAMNGRLRIVA